jgi:hypothetical protein
VARPRSALSDKDHRRWVRLVRALLQHYKLQARDITLKGSYREIERALNLGEALSGPRARKLSYALLNKIAPLCKRRSEFYLIWDRFGFIWTDSDLKAEYRKRSSRKPVPPQAICTFNPSDVAFALTQALIDADVIAATGKLASRIEQRLAEYLEATRYESALSFANHLEWEYAALEAKGGTFDSLRDYFDFTLGKKPKLFIRLNEEYRENRERIEQMPGDTRTEKLANYLREKAEQVREPPCTCDICEGRLEEV